jgi:hypothetical protein
VQHPDLPAVLSESDRDKAWGVYGDAFTAPLTRPRVHAGRTGSPWTFVLIVALLYAAMALAYSVAIAPRVTGGYQFIHIGETFLTKGSSSTVIQPSLGFDNEVGYDGQFYFFLAADPAHAHDYLDSPGIVYSRIVYPMAARALSLGDIRAIPYAMILLNLAAVIAGTLFVAIWLRRHRLPPAYALLYGLFPGLIFACFRDLTEPLAYALVAGAVLLFDRSTSWRLAVSATVFAIAALTRETTLVFPAVLTLSLLLGRGETGSWGLRAGRAWLRAASFGAGVLVPLLAWRLFLSFWLGGAPTQESAGGLSALVPFHGLAAWWPWSRMHVLILVSVVLPSLLSLAIVVAALRHKMTAYLWIVVANIVAFVVFLPYVVYVDYFAAGRAAIGVVLALLLALPACTAALGQASRSIRTSLAFWSLPYYLLVLVVLWG